MTKIYDSEPIKNSLNRNIKLLKELTEDKEIIKKIEDIEINIIKEIDEQIKIIYLSPQIKQTFNWWIGNYQLCHTEDKYWYLYNAVNLIITLPEMKQILIDLYGEQNYYTIKNKLPQYGQTLIVIKRYADIVGDKLLKDKEIETEIEKKYIRTLIRLPIILKNLHQLYVIICQYTNLGKNSVPNSVHQALQKQYKKIEENKTQTAQKRDME